MNAPPSLTTPQRNRSDGSRTSCPVPLDDDGRTGWWHVLALQAHVVIVRLAVENRRLRADRLPVCDLCGAQPCVNPSFCAACRVADRKRKRNGAVK